MESKFTPGPWTAGGTKPFKGNEAWIFDSSNPEKLVANVRPNLIDSTISMEEAFYNAHLIAAAPDLLKALEEVISVSDRKTDIYDRAKVAIRKALNILQ
jgi:hypothetical protein